MFPRLVDFYYCHNSAIVFFSSLSLVFSEIYLIISLCFLMKLLEVDSCKIV
jgi:hypothetical protein